MKTRTLVRPRETEDAVMSVEWSQDDRRPEPEWVTITRQYEGEGNAVDTVEMTLAEFRWLVGIADDLPIGS